MALNMLAYWDFDTLQSGQFSDRTGRGGNLATTNGYQGAAKLGTYGGEWYYGTNGASISGPMISGPLTLNIPMVLYGWFSVYEPVNGWTRVVSITNPALAVEILDDGEKLIGIRGVRASGNGATVTLDLWPGEWVFFAVAQDINPLLSAWPAWYYHGGDSNWAALGDEISNPYTDVLPTSLTAGNDSGYVLVDELGMACWMPYSVGRIEWVYNEGNGRPFSDYGYMPDPEVDPDPDPPEEDFGEWAGYYSITSRADQIEHVILQAYIDLTLIPAGHAWWTNVAEDGQDIRITDEAGNSLRFRLETFDKDAKTGTIQFDSSGTLSSTSDVTYRIYAGNPTADPIPDYLVHRASGSPIFAFDMAQDPSGTAPQMRDLLKHVPGTTHGSMVSGDLVPGRAGNAISFGNGQWIDFPSSTFNNPTSAATLMLWVLFYSGGHTAQQLVVARNHNSTAASGIGIDLGLNKIRMDVAKSGSWAGALSANAEIAYNTWYHVAATYTSGQRRLYINGVQQSATGSDTGSISWLAGHNWTIGYNTALTLNTQAEIDEIKLYGRVLSVDEIVTHYRNELTAEGIWRTVSPRSAYYYYYLLGM